MISYVKNIQSNNLVNWFRKVAIAEGISFLVLILIAMPLKYFAGLPEAVKMVGWAHGVLFVGYQVLAFGVMVNAGKNFFWLMKAFIASLVPFGTFVFDRQYQNKKCGRLENPPR
jgi:integral membrane protein